MDKENVGKQGRLIDIGGFSSFIEEMIERLGYCNLTSKTGLSRNTLDNWIKTKSARQGALALFCKGLNLPPEFIPQIPEKLCDELRTFWNMPWH